MFILSIIFYQSQGCQLIVGNIQQPAVHILLAKTAKVLV